jgi:translocation and assembly module TamA
VFFLQMGLLFIAATVSLAVSFPARAAAPSLSYEVELQAPQAYRLILESNLDLMRWRDNPRVDAEQLRRLIGRAEANVRTIMETLGHYAPQVSVSLDETGVTPRVKIGVAPGKPVEVGRVHLEFRGAISQSLDTEEPRVDTLRENWSLQTGEVFRHAAWEDAKRSTLRSLVARRYPRARIVSSRATVDPAAREAALELVIDSGPVYRFGALSIEGLTRYPASIIENLNPVKPGNVYSQEALFSLQSVLQDTGYFDSVTVEVDTANAAPDRLPVKVTVIEKKTRRLGFGIGVSTDTGVRGQVEYEDSNFFGGGQRLTLGLKAHAKEQKATASLAFPVRADGTRDSIATEYAQTDIQGERTEKFGLGLRRAWVSGRIEHIAGLDFKTETLRLSGAEPENSHTLVPNYAWTWRAIDSPVMPQRGHILRLQIGAASEALLSTQDFVRGYGKWNGFFPVGSSSTLVLRAEVGALLSDLRDGIPSDYLFRTGGDQSVRGYAYQSLGVQEGAAITGGRVLGVASAEFVRWLTPKWGAAVFYDAGDAADSWREFSAKHGYGVGARWRSPVGPVSLDIAYGQDVGKLRLHFSLGVAF